MHLQVKGNFEELCCALGPELYDDVHSLHTARQTLLDDTLPRLRCKRALAAVQTFIDEVNKLHASLTKDHESLRKVCQLMNFEGYTARPAWANGAHLFLTKSVADEIRETVEDWSVYKKCDILVSCEFEDVVRRVLNASIRRSTREQGVLHLSSFPRLHAEALWQDPDWEIQASLAARRRLKNRDLEQADEAPGKRLFVREAHRVSISELWERRTHTTGSAPHGQTGWRSYGQAATRKRFGNNQDDNDDAASVMTCASELADAISDLCPELIPVDGVDPLHIEVTTAKDEALISTISMRVMDTLSKAGHSCEQAFAQACQSQLAVLASGILQMRSKDKKQCITICAKLVARFWQGMIQEISKEASVTCATTASSRSLSGPKQHARDTVTAVLVELGQLVEKELCQHTSKLHRHLQKDFEDIAGTGLAAQADFLFKAVADIVPQKMFTESRINDLVATCFRSVADERDQLRRNAQTAAKRREGGSSHSPRPCERSRTAPTMVAKEGQRLANKRDLERKGGRQKNITDSGRDGRGWKRERDIPI